MTNDSDIGHRSISQIRIRRDADVTRAVVQAGTAALQIGFDAHAKQLISTTVSELTRNILKYAGSGDCLIAAVRDRDRSGIQITVRDKGPGIADLEQALSDHYSSSGTLGLGLPAVKRMMDDFHITSAPDAGTTIIVTKWLPAAAATSLRMGR